MSRTAAQICTCEMTGLFMKIISSNSQLPATTSCRRHFACTPVFMLWYLQQRRYISQQIRAWAPTVHYRNNVWEVAIIINQIYYAVASSGKRNATVWRPSFCLSRRHTHRDSPGVVCDAASVHFGPTIRTTDILAIIRPRRMHAVHKMRPINVARSVVCLSVC